MAASKAYRCVLALAAGLAACKQDAVDTLPSCDTVQVTTIAGNGEICGQEPGEQQDCFADGTGGPNGTAKFNWPMGVVVDSLGNVYVADMLNARIRKIDTSGNVTTVVGQTEPYGYSQQCSMDTSPPNWTCAPDWISIDSHDNIYYPGYGGVIKMDTTSGSWSIVPNNGGQWSPSQIAIDSTGDIYWFECEIGNCPIMTMSPTGVVSAYVGGSTSGYVNGPASVAEFGAFLAITTDLSGNLYIADTDYSEGAYIRKVDPSRNVTTLAGNDIPGDVDGPGNSAEFFFPQGLATDTRGNVYVADSWNNRIRRIDTTGNVTTMAGSGPTEPMGIVEIAEFSDGTAGPNGKARFNVPTSVAVDKEGNVYVADSRNNRVRKISACQ